MSLAAGHSAEARAEEETGAPGLARWNRRPASSAWMRACRDRSRLQVPGRPHPASGGRGGLICGGGWELSPQSLRPSPRGW